MMYYSLQRKTRVKSEEPEHEHLASPTGSIACPWGWRGWMLAGQVCASKNVRLDSSHPLFPLRVQDTLEKLQPRAESCCLETRIKVGRQRPSRKVRCMWLVERTWSRHLGHSCSYLQMKKLRKLSQAMVPILLPGAWHNLYFFESQMSLIAKYIIISCTTKKGNATG